MDFITTTTIKRSYEHGLAFVVAKGDDEKYYAIRSKSPYFCFEAESELHAEFKAIEAIKFYKAHKP